MRRRSFRFWVNIDKVIGISAIVAIFCFIFVKAHRAVMDLDIWLHLKAGEVILNSRAIPSSDVFSFTRLGQPWVDHEWLFQVTAALVYKFLKADGLILLQCYVIIASFLLLFLMLYKSTRSYAESAVFLFLAAAASSSRFNIRPDICSILFFSLYLYILRFSPGRKRIWLLPFVQAAWVNIHGYFFLGPLLVFVFALKKGETRLRLVLFFVILASMLNPRGWEGLLYPLSVVRETLSGENRVFFENIQELKATFASDASWRYFYNIIALLTAVFMCARFRRLKLVDVTLVIFFFVFALTSRNVVFFAFTAAALAAAYFAPLRQEVVKMAKLELAPGRRVYYLTRYLLCGLFVFYLCGEAKDTFQANKKGYYDFKTNRYVTLLSGIEEECYPKGAVDFVLANKLPGKMFNDFNSGAYLIGRSFPGRRVFIDGRTELYGSAFFKKYKDALNGNTAAFKELEDKYDFKAALLSMTSVSAPKLAGRLYKNPRWKLVYLDHLGVVFLRDLPENRALIAQYKIDLRKYEPPQADLKALGLNAPLPKPYLKRAQLFEVMGESALALKEAQEALRVKPNYAQAFHIRGRIYLRQKKLDLALANLRSTLLFEPRNVKAMLELSACLKELKEYNSALSLLKGAARLDKKGATLHLRMAEIYILLQRPAEAARELDVCLRLNAGKDKELEKKIDAKRKEIKNISKG